MFLKGHDQLIIVIELFLNTQNKNIRFYVSNETSFIYLGQKMRKLLAFQKDYIFFLDTRSFKLLDKVCVFIPAITYQTSANEPLNI